MREMTRKEVTDIYKTYLKYDFPDDERRPLSAILYLIKEGHYQGYIEQIENKTVGYAFLYFHHQTALLDYFAIVPSLRQKGYGSAFLQTITKTFPNIFLEAEEPFYETSKRRIEFYSKNGFQINDTKITLFGVRYLLLSREKMGGLEFKDFYSALYPGHFPYLKFH